MKPCPACSLLHSFIHSLPVRGTGGGWGFSRCWFSGGRAPVYGHLRDTCVSLTRWGEGRAAGCQERVTISLLKPPGGFSFST